MRSVFVGSSSEGRPEAAEVRELLENKDTETVFWPEIFAPSSLTFEALEDMLLECCGAVFVATPDDHGAIRGRPVEMPRANVMLEFGLGADTFYTANNQTYSNLLGGSASGVSTITAID